MRDNQGAARSEAVHGVSVPRPSHLTSARSAASSWRYHLPLKSGRGRICVSSCRLNGWCKVLLFVSSCCLLCALSSCGGSIIVKGASAGTLEASPKTVTFGSVQIGKAANTTVSILNNGSAPVQIAQLNLSGQPFSLVGLSNLPVTIAAGATHILNVQFSPAAAGTATGRLTIADNSSTSAMPVINLSGTGTTGAASAALSALYCSSGTMSGSGTDVCTLTLTAAAPSGGLTVNLSSTNSAVTVQNTVIVPANATSAEFMANVTSVATAQAVTITANAGGVMKNFTLQLNTAIIALSINATSVAFGDVLVNTAATQSLTLTSTGTLPVTVNGATLTGVGFTMSGAAFPATLSPGQQAILSVEFNPTEVGAVTGKLAITSNSTGDGTAVIGLGGTGTSVVALTVAPNSVSTTVAATQQFSASVIGTSNTAVTWSESGAGCSGASCGTISSKGLYTAPATVPSPPTVTIKATSAFDPGKSATAIVTVLPSVGTTYYLAPAANGGNDLNSGLSPSAPWLSPNHSVSCGDVIIAASSSSYSSSNFETGNWGTVTCPAANNVAWLKCVAFDTCKIDSSAGEPGFYVDRSFWGVQGWEVTASHSNSNWCFGAAPNFNRPEEIHHIIFANNVANGCQQGGFVSFNQGIFAGVDYLAIVGNIAYDAARGRLNCFSGISVYQPIQSDSLPGTHIYIAGNFSWGNFDANPCAGGAPTDGNGIIFDTFDGDQGALSASYQAQAVADNNILIANGGRGLQVGNNAIGTGPFAPIVLRNNTLWGNNRDLNQNSGHCGELLLDSTYTTQAFLNLAVTNAPDGCGANPIYAYFVGKSATTTNQVFDNWGFALHGTNGGINNSSGFSYSSSNTFGVDPNFVNPVAPSAPLCAGYADVPACMAKVVSNFTPGNVAARRYGYQVPSAVPVFDSLFPQWLCDVTLPAGLVTMGCQATP